MRHRFGQKDSMEGETLNTGQMGGWGMPGSGSTYPWCSCLPGTSCKEGRTKTLCRNLLLPFQGRLRQQGGTEKEDTSDPDVEDDEIPEVSGMPVTYSKIQEERPHT